MKKRTKRTIRREKKIYCKGDRAITLIALIVTIIVLLILAGVTINMAISNNGIFSKAKTAGRVYSEKEATEQAGLLMLEYQMEKAQDDSLTLQKFLTDKDVNYEEDGDNLNLFVDGYIVTVDKNGTIISAERDAGVQPKVTAKVYTSEGKEVTSDSGAQKNEYITIVVENKSDLSSIDSIQVFNESGTELTEKSSSPIGNTSAEVSYKIVENGKYTIKVKGTKDGTQRTKTASITISNIIPNYTGYYADVNDDGIVDGVIFIDLAYGASGQWGDGNGKYSYSAVTSGLSSYKISTKTSSYSGKFGTKSVIAPNGTSGSPRFYVMALSDFDTSKHTWSDACSKNQTVGSVKFRLPSKMEWAAFGGQFGITGSDYSSKYGLSGWYWSSTEDDSSHAWYADFNGGYLSTIGRTRDGCVRLCATF